MDHLQDEYLPEKRSAFLTVLCILTFIGSAWGIFSAITAYNTAGVTAAVFKDSIINRKSVIIAEKDIAKNEKDSLSAGAIKSDSISEIKSTQTDSVFAHSGIMDEEVPNHANSKEFETGTFFGEKMKNNVLDMIAPEKIKNSATGSFIAALLTLAGAIFMWYQRRTGFYLYLSGVLLGIIIPFYIYWNNSLAIGISAFSGFFGLLFIALYALNIKSMK